MTFTELERIANENPYIMRVKRTRGETFVWMIWNGVQGHIFWRNEVFDNLKHSAVFKDLFGHLRNHPKREFFSMGFVNGKEE